MKGFHLFQVIHFVAYFIVGLWGEGEGGGEKVKSYINSQASFQMVKMLIFST